MPTWRNNDREESKPSWLNPAQKINCVRTVRGWEIPQHGSSLGSNFDGSKGYTSVFYGSTGGTASPKTELIVCIPNDPVYNPQVVITVTGVGQEFTQGISGFSLTAGASVFFGTLPYTGTANALSVGTIIASTGGVSSFTIQLNSFNLLNGGGAGGYGSVVVGGIAQSIGPGGTTGTTAQIQTVSRIMDTFSSSGFYTSRQVATGGHTFGGDTPNYRPYITVPFNGDGATSGGLDGTGLSFGTTGAHAGFTGVAVVGSTGFGFYAVNQYGAGTLNFPGATAYIKVVANDSNFTQQIAMSLPAESGQQFGDPGAVLIQGNNLINGTVPISVYEAFFGPTASVNNNIGVIQIRRGGATANQNYKMVIRATDNGAGGLTSDSAVFVKFGAAANG